MAKNGLCVAREGTVWSGAKCNACWPRPIAATRAFQLFSVVFQTGLATFCLQWRCDENITRFKSVRKGTPKTVMPFISPTSFKLTNTSGNLY